MCHPCQWLTSAASKGLGESRSCVDITHLLLVAQWHPEPRQYPGGAQLSPPKGCSARPLVARTGMMGIDRAGLSHDSEIFLALGGNEGSGGPEPCPRPRSYSEVEPPHCPNSPATSTSPPTSAHCTLTCLSPLDSELLEDIGESIVPHCWHQ